MTNVKRIHVVLDLSMSMAEMIGPVYMFLTGLVKRIGDKPGYCYSLTWFTGIDSQTKQAEFHTELFSDRKRHTSQPSELLDAIRSKTMEAGKASTSEIIHKAIRDAINELESDEKEFETELLLFTDYNCSNYKFSDSNDKCVRRAILFVQKSLSGIIRASFKFATEEGRTRNIPVNIMALESLTEQWTEQDWFSFLDMI